MAAGAALIEQLVGRGFDEETAFSRARLVTTAEEALRSSVPGASWRWVVPGRIEVFGKHTDYAGGRALLAAAPRGLAVVASERADGLVRVVDARSGDEALVDPAKAGEVRGWRSYAAVVARRLAGNFPGAPLGTHIAFASDLPRAAGLSSSSALVVGIGMALARRAGLALRDDWRRAIETPQDLAAYFGCIENGSAFRTLAGTGGVGTEGGSEDHTAILMCRPKALSEYAFGPVRHVGDVGMPEDWCFVIASSGVHADKAGTVRQRYNRASLAARALVRIWNDISGASSSSLAAAVAAAPEAADRLRAALKRAPTPEFSSEELIRRLEHFIKEDGRVPHAARAFAQGDTETIGELSRASQTDAEALLGNQVPETIDLANAAHACGALAACSFGAGFGGSVWALVRSGDAQAFGEEWSASYRARHPELSRTEWFTARPGPAVTEVA